MANSYEVYHNPKTVTIGSTSITGVQSITISQPRTEVHSAGDADAYESVAVYSTARTTGAIVLADPLQADSVAGSSGTLSFVWTDVRGTTDKTVTVSGCQLGGWSSEVARNDASVAVVPFIAASEDGTDPVSIA
jgi:hypothetical protein